MDKKRLLLPLFIFRLILVNLAFFVSIAVIPIHKQKLLFFSSVTLILYLIFLGKHIIPKKQQLTDPIKLINVTSEKKELISFKDFSKIKLFKDKLNGINKISPGNRNVLVNLSLISFYQNKMENHHRLWNKAVETDPNNSLFKNN